MVGRNNKRRKMVFRNAHNKRDCPMCSSNKLHSTRRRLEATGTKPTKFDDIFHRGV